MTFRRLNGEWKSDQAGISLWVWVKPTYVLYFYENQILAYIIPSNPF